MRWKLKSCHYQKEGANILLVAKVIMCVVSRDCSEGVMGAEPFIKEASGWHAFPVEITFATTKDINIKLSLKCTEIML